MKTELKANIITSASRQNICTARVEGPLISTELEENGRGEINFSHVHALSL